MTSKELGHYAVAIFFVVVPYWVPMPIYTAFSACAVLVLLNRTHFVVNKKIFSLIFPVAFLLPVGLINSWHWSVTDILRDCWYVINPMIILLGGWLYCEKIKGDIFIIFKAILVSGVVSSLYHLYEVYALVPKLTGGLSDLGVMTLEKKGSVLAVMALSVLLFSGFERLVELTKPVRVLIFLICTASFCFSLSRSWSVALIILFIGVYVLKTKNIRSAFVIGGITLIPIISYLLIYSSFQDIECTSFFCKVSISLKEMLPRDYLFEQDLGMYWRGYETYIAMQQYQGGNLFEMAFGQGLGALVDLKLSIALEGKQYDMIPILHNGYAYLLVKFGFLGLILFIAQCFTYAGLGLQCFSDNRNNKRLVGAYIFALASIIIVLTFANAGFFNKYSLIPVLFFMAAFIRVRWYIEDKPH